MSIDILSDSHVHTAMCRHAAGTMEEYVLAALDKGLRRITFLEHLEEGIGYFERTWLTEEDFDFYFAEGHRLQEHYTGRIEIGLGVEIGYNPECIDRILERLGHRKWDLVGLSYHYCRLPGREQHLNLLSKKQKNIDIVHRYGPEKLLYQYLEGLIQAVRTIPAQMLCHLDAGLRYQPGLVFAKVHLELIQELLESVRQASMALEVNTSGFPVRGEPFPGRGIIRQALGLGIPLRASSDAHTPAQVGRHFEQLPEIIDQAGAEPDD